MQASCMSCAASLQVEGRLNAIIPRLYRYCYDPMPRVQESMSRLWSVLVCAKGHPATWLPAHELPVRPLAAQPP